MTDVAPWMVVVVRAWRHNDEFVVRLLRTGAGGDDHDVCVVRGSDGAAGQIKAWLDELQR